MNPTQVGIPNDRPRYYGVAVLSQDNKHVAANKTGDSLTDYLSFETDLQSPPIMHSSIPELDVVPLDNISNLSPISHFLDDDDTTTDKDDLLRIPDKMLQSRAAWCFDIVSPEDRRSACFTQSYGKFIRGTGSVLWEPPTCNGDDDNACSRFALLPPEEREFNPDWAEGLDLKKNLRYFSGMEVARLMGFDDKVLSFPPDCTLKQHWKLLGNSLNVQVASRIVELCIQKVMS